MDFFGIGLLEVALIFIVAFIIFGPERLAEISRIAGKTLGNLSRTASSFKIKFDQEINIENLTSSKQPEPGDGAIIKDTRLPK